MYDCHVHSDFSGDSNLSAEQACEKAIQMGFSGIAFTDHLDIDFPGYDDTFLIDFEKYFSFMNRIKYKYESYLRILIGIEVGIQPHIINETLKVVENYDFDYVISSVHIIDKKDPASPEFFLGESKESAFRRYLEEIYYSISNYENFDIVGHIGYIRRYCNYDNTSISYVDFSDILDSILSKLIESGKGIEVNTSGYTHNKLKSPMPDFDIVKRYKELGGEIICIGSDAHTVDGIGLNFDVVAERLKEIGFKHLTHFEKRKPVFELI